MHRTAEILSNLFYHIKLDNKLDRLDDKIAKLKKKSSKVIEMDSNRLFLQRGGDASLKQKHKQRKNETDLKPMVNQLKGRYRGVYIWKTKTSDAVANTL